MNKKQDSKPENQTPSFFKELGGFMKPYQYYYGSSIVLSITAVFMNVLSYVFVGLIVAMLFSEINQNIWLYVILTITCKILYALLLNLSTWLSHQGAYKTLRDVRTAMMNKMLRLPLGYFETNGSGRLKYLICDQVEGMEKPLAHVLPEMTANLLVPLLLLVYMFFVDWRLALAALIWIILGFSITGGMMKNYPEKFAGQIKAEKEMSQAISEYVGGIEVIKNFGQIDRSSEKYEKAVNHHAAYNVNWQKETQIYSAFGMAVAPFSIFPVLIVGVLLFAYQGLSASTLFLAALLTMGIFNPLMQTMGYYDQLAQMGTIAKELRDILDYPELQRGTLEASENCDIEFKDVTFAYGKETKPAIEDVSFKVKEGSMLALVGPSGSGKSTIAKLLAGHWDANEGEITIGEHKISEYSQDALNNLIAYVDQDTFLFDEPIVDNIRIGNSDLTNEDVTRISKEIGIDEFISKLENGYATLAGNAGSKLSGGEKQRIAIARAMCKDAPIIILDEATASADPENETKIQQALSQVAKGKTLIVVAHHLSTIVDADQIAFMQDGKIVAIGKHETLLEEVPAYRALWDLSKEG